jgi:hypothetical protein
MLVSTLAHSSALSLRNVCWLSRDYTALYARRHCCENLKSYMLTILFLLYQLFKKCLKQWNNVFCHRKVRSLFHLLFFTAINSPYFLLSTNLEMRCITELYCIQHGTQRTIGLRVYRSAAYFGSIANFVGILLPTISRKSQFCSTHGNSNSTGVVYCCTLSNTSQVTGRKGAGSSRERICWRENRRGD